MRVYVICLKNKMHANDYIFIITRIYSCIRKCLLNQSGFKTMLTSFYVGVE